MCEDALLEKETHCLPTETKLSIGKNYWIMDCKTEISQKTLNKCLNSPWIPSTWSGQEKKICWTQTLGAKL